MEINFLKGMYKSSQSESGYKYIYKYTTCGSNYWYVQYRANGRRFVKCFPQTESGLEHALVWLHDTIKEINRPKLNWKGEA